MHITVVLAENWVHLLVGVKSKDITKDTKIRRSETKQEPAGLLGIKLFSVLVSCLWEIDFRHHNLP